MRSLHRSSPNSCCSDGLHTLPVGLCESSGHVKLVTLVHFGGRSKFSSGADKRSGLGHGDSNGVVGVLVPRFG